MKRIAILLAVVAVALLPSCSTTDDGGGGWTVTGQIAIPNPVAGKEPIGHLNISKTWYGKTKKEVVPALPADGKAPVENPLLP